MDESGEGAGGGAGEGAGEGGNEGIGEGVWCRPPGAGTLKGASADRRWGHWMSIELGNPPLILVTLTPLSWGGREEGGGDYPLLINNTIDIFQYID